MKKLLIILSMLVMFSWDTDSILVTEPDLMSMGDTTEDTLVPCCVDPPEVNLMMAENQGNDLDCYGHLFIL